MTEESSWWTHSESAAKECKLYQWNGLHRHLFTTRWPRRNFHLDEWLWAMCCENYALQVVCFWFKWKMDTLRTAGCRILGTEETFQKVNSHDMKKRTVWSTGGVGVPLDLPMLRAWISFGGRWKGEASYICSKLKSNFFSAYLNHCC